MNVGTFNAQDNIYLSNFSGSLIYSIQFDSTDNTYSFNALAWTIFPSFHLDPVAFFRQEDILSRGSNTLVFDTTVIDSTTFTVRKIIPGTESLTLETWTSSFDGTYRSGKMNPIWINYRIQQFDSSADTTGHTVGYNLRTPVNPSVGNFYAPMVVPNNVGKYQIQWFFQKDSSSFVNKVSQDFYVNSLGIDSTNIFR